MLNLVTFGVKIKKFKLTNAFLTMNKNIIYFDYAATTPLDPRVLKKMNPYLKEKFGNPGSSHFLGQQAKSDLEKSKEIISQIIKAEPEEIIFTGSATESNNLALKGIAFLNFQKKKHIIVSAIEHDSILKPTQWLASQGWKITKLAVDKFGLIRTEDLEKAISKETVLVSIMHANNEIGAIEPIAEIGKICKRKNVLFHTDASQSFGKIPLDVKKMNIDLLTASSHKIYGPLGTGCLFIKKGIKIESLIHGGGQEFGLRSSTPNLPSIIGFAEAAKISQKSMIKENQRLIKLREKLIKGILKSIPRSRLNGHPKKRLFNNINFSFSFVEGEAIVAKLNAYGIAASTTSACASEKLEPSHVLLACGLKPQEAQGSLRISLGRWTKEKDINFLLKVLPEIVKNLRKISPFKG